MISRGGLTGRVLMAEVAGIRQVQFLPNGTVTDIALESTGEGSQGIVGAIGAQP